jgi:hypothetical protein
VVVPAFAACGGQQRGGTTLYFLQASPRPVLEAIERKPKLPTPGEVLAALAHGPTRAERLDGLKPVIHVPARSFKVGVRGRTADVSYSGPELTLTAVAALVFSLSELDGIDAVSLHRNDEPCCVYDHAGRVIDPLTRRLFRGWSREPCEARIYADAVPCRA